MHRHNLAKNTGEGGRGQNQPWVLEILIYQEVKLERGIRLV